MIKTFNDLDFKDHPLGIGKASRIIFENGFGVSVVISELTYGGSQGLYELAVLDSNGHITYNTTITNDVIGHLTPDEVTEVMKDVQSLIKITNDTSAQ